MIRHIFITFASLLVGFWTGIMLLVGIGHAQTLTALNADETAKLKAYLQDYLKRPNMAAESTTRFVAAFVDLNGDSKSEAIVYVVGRARCGSGGCVTLVLEPTNSSYRLVTRMTITRPPIRVLESRSHGWRSISVWVQGGGTVEGYNAELQFDGTSYPKNPSMPPAKRRSAQGDGDTVISSLREAVPLYP